MRGLCSDDACGQGGPCQCDQPAQVEPMAGAGYRPFGFSWVLWLIGVGLAVACVLSLVLT